MIIFVLFDGLAGGDGYPVKAFKTKKALRDFVRTEYPGAKGTNRLSKSELYWEYGGTHGAPGAGWLNVHEIELHV